MRALHHVHQRVVHSRRVRVLHGHLVPLLRESRSILDVGCGDGRISRCIAASLPDARVSGLDVQVREGARIDVEAFDGRTIPLEEDAVDTVLLIDVLHHTEAPAVLLAEARRVARRNIVIKDHTKAGWLAGPTLRFMDWVGNARHDVARPHTYLTRGQWDQLFETTGVVIEQWMPKLGLYGFPGDLLFGRGLHFLACLRARV